MKSSNNLSNDLLLKEIDNLNTKINTLNEGVEANKDNANAIKIFIIETYLRSTLDARRNEFKNYFEFMECISKEKLIFLNWDYYAMQDCRPFPNNSEVIRLIDKKELFDFLYADRYFMWALQPGLINMSAINKAMFFEKPVAFSECGLLLHFGINDICMTSFLLDDISLYLDSRHETRLEQMLNDENFIVTNEQKQRAKACIEKITTNYVTKYNVAPIFTPNIGSNKKKVLVVDQIYGDMSVHLGMSSTNTFKIMLEAAINENPNSDIIIKSTPTIDPRPSYYGSQINVDEYTAKYSNVYHYRETIHPMSMINYVDKVYVCTSQMGLEALMLGKETHIFGMPFYGGYGLNAHEKLKHPRRKHKRSLEELFYIMYIIYTYYVMPSTNERCEIEDFIDDIIKLRDEHFKKHNIPFEKHI